MIDGLLGLDLRPVELAHKGELAEVLRRHPHGLSGYTYAALFVWQKTFQYGWARCGPDALVFTARIDPDLDRHLLQPIGRLDGACAERLLETAHELPYRLQVVGADRRFLDDNPGFAARFEVVEDRDNANYIYAAEDLAELPGRRFASKRNLIAQARRAYAWTVEPVTTDNASACCAILRRIRDEEPDLWEMTPTLKEELRALEMTIENFGALEQEGVLVRVEGQPAGFSLFEAQSPEIGVIHFERALRAHKGLHQVVQNEAAKTIAGRGFKFINREEDLGNEGLRQAKLSYNPVKIEMAYRLVLGSG